jgi:menaquinone-specific isochorismate synthase
MSSIILPPSSETISDLIAASNSRLQARGVQSQPTLFFLTIKLEAFDILQWLKAATTFPRIYWMNRENTLEYGGIGDALAQFPWRNPSFPLQIDELQRLFVASEAPEQARAFVCCAFDPTARTDAVWADFPRQCLQLPELCVIKQGSQATAVISLLADNENSSQLQKRILTLLKSLELSQPVNLPAARAASRRDFPGETRWREIVSLAVAAIRSRKLEKIVLARRTDFERESSEDAVDLLTEFSTRAANSYLIMYAPSAKAAFVSISPERLLRNHGRTLSTEAVAGTVQRGQSEIEDLALENRLRNSLKDRSEQQFVVDGISRSLSPLCDKVEVSNAASVMKLQRVQHLISEFRAILKADSSLGQVFAALHPTAAVCGTPREDSRQRLAEWEQFDRGWYASGIGLVGSDQAEFAVGIRSAVLRDRELSIFTGAGIVSQSDPAIEWMELEDKLQSIVPSRLGDAD